MNVKIFNRYFIVIVILFTGLSGQSRKPHLIRRQGVQYLEPKHYSFPDSATRKIKIWGEVEQPGIYIVPKQLGLFDILTLAGGPKASADLSRVKLFNPMMAVEGENLKKIIDLEYFLQKGKFELEPKLGNESVIIVPKNNKAKFFNSLPKILNVLNIVSVTILIVSWIR